LTKVVDDVIVEDWSVEKLDALTNAQFTSLMCKAKGYSTSDKANWVNFESDWDECLSQASRTAEIDKKRLILVYRESIHA